MTTVPAQERCEELPAEPVSARKARRVVLDALSDWSLGDLCDDAALLVSEVVTNSLLHAGSAMGLTVRRLDEGVRVEVRDHSRTMPAPRNYAGDSVTGRGLDILDLTAANWGAELFEDGKVVWFELGTEQPRAGSADGVRGGPSDAQFTVRLIRTPVALARATFDYGDGMLRELALLSFSAGEGLPAMPRVVTPDLNLGEMLQALAVASGEDRRHVDVELHLPTRSASAALERLALIDEADRMAHEGRLLLPAGLPEIAHCRRWMMGEIVGQASGNPPTPWSDLEEAETALPAQGISAADEALLGADLDWTFVADEGNRIQFAGAQAAQFLGWDPEDLAGRRVTTLVPPELREAHLVGFTRYQLTRHPVLMGQPVAVDAVHRNGSTVPVTLLLREMPARDGRLRYRARLSPGH